jgi:hypothetical protein
MLLGVFKKCCRTILRCFEQKLAYMSFSLIFIIYSLSKVRDREMKIFLDLLIETDMNVTLLKLIRVS